MFICSMKFTKRKLFFLLACAIVSVGLIVTVTSKDEIAPVSTGNDLSYEGGTQEQRIAFLGQLGWEASGDGAEVCEVQIPDEFDQVYESYNAIQKENGLDLTRYRGKRVKRYTYVITNYPDYSGRVVANLMVYKEKIIGGDICSLELDGFIHGFIKG